MELPLRYDIDDLVIVDSDGACVVTLECSDFTADFDGKHGREIVAAVNAHAGLVSTLENVERRMVARTDLETNLPSDLQAILAVVRDGLASAKGGAS